MQVGSKLLDERQQLVRQLPAGPADGARQDSSLLAQLCRETVQDGHSVLIFCGTKWVSSSSATHAGPTAHNCFERLSAAGQLLILPFWHVS